MILCRPLNLLPDLQARNKTTHTLSHLSRNSQEDRGRRSLEMAALAQPIPTESYGKGPGLSGGAIAGIVIGVIIGTFALITACAYLSLRKRIQRNQTRENGNEARARRKLDPERQ